MLGVFPLKCVGLFLIILKIIGNGSVSFPLNCVGLFLVLFCGGLVDH